MSGGTYAQNFDSLADSGSANAWADNSTLPGWYASKQVAPNAITTYRADTGSGTTGALDSYGAAANRALGCLVSGTPGDIAFGLRFTNDTASVQGSILVSFTAEQWRNANTLAQTLAFFYQTGTALTNADGTNSLAWNSFSALDFTTPTVGESGALDGTAATNQIVFTNVLLSGVTIQPGQELFLRWFFTRPAAGSSHGVAIDNLTVSFSPSNSPPPVTPAATTQARTLRIVTYNIEDDIDGATTTLPGLIAPPGSPDSFTNGGVLEGIGEEIVSNDPAQPLDILALEETTSNPITIAPIVSGLNAFYGVAGMYSNSTYQATEVGGDVTNGNGPNALVYNTKTVQLLASAPVDPPGGTGKLGSASGEYREVMRYEFAPAGVATNAANVFYIYVSHYKSNSTGTLATNQFYRNGEAQIIRNDAATLPATARMLHVGDFNTGDASEPMYATLIASGTNQFLDPVNPSGNATLNWDGSATLNVKTESAILLHYRDDYQMMTTNVYSGAAGGLEYVPGTCHVFGNNSTTPYLGNVNSGSNTSLSNNLATNAPVFISATQLYLDLTNASDHLPVVADYTIPLPTPVISSVSLAGTNLVFNVANCTTGGIFTVLMSTNLSLPLANWTALAATNTTAAGSFTFTATNAVNPAAPQEFFRLQEK